MPRREEESSSEHSESESPFYAFIQGLDLGDESEGASEGASPNNPNSPDSGDATGSWATYGRFFTDTESFVNEGPTTFYEILQVMNWVIPFSEEVFSAFIQGDMSETEVGEFRSSLPDEKKLHQMDEKTLQTFLGIVHAFLGFVEEDRFGLMRGRDDLNPIMVLLFEMVTQAEQETANREHDAEELDAREYLDQIFAELNVKIMLAFNRLSEGADKDAIQAKKTLANKTLTKLLSEIQKIHEGLRYQRGGLEEIKHTFESMFTFQENGDFEFDKNVFKLAVNKLNEVAHSTLW